MKFYYLFAVLAMTGCQRALGPVTVAPEWYGVDEGVMARTQVQGPGGKGSAEELAEVIAPYKEQLDDRMNRVLAEVKTPLVKSTPESNLGNWMADLMYAAAEEYYPGKDIAFAVTNIGGLRAAKIGSGPLLVSEIYELMPFDNKLVLVELTGKELKEFLNHVANAGGWPVSEQLAVSRRDRKLKVLIDGQALEFGRTYLVATIDYVANGGSNSTMLRGKPQQFSGHFLRDVLIDFAGRSTEPIEVVSEGKRFRLD